MTNRLKIIILACTILIVNSVVSAQENHKDMKTIFKTEVKPSVTVEQIRNEDRWIKTIVTNRKLNKSIELENLVYPNESRSLSKKFGYILPQDNDRILDACSLHEDLFILQAIAGKLILDRVKFYSHNNFKRDRYLLGSVNVLPSSGGELHYRFKWEIGGNYLFFYVDGTHTGTTSFIGHFDVISGRLFEYKFSDDSIRIEDENSMFVDMDFNQNRSWTIINEAIKKIFIEQGRVAENKHFQYLFSFDVSNFELLGQRTQGTTYFFYKDDHPYGQVKVMYYDHYESEWVLNKYREIDIEPMK